MPYLLHPNLWIRQATARFVSATASILESVDVVVKLSTIVSPFMQRNVIQMHNQTLIMANIAPHIPR